jgi:ATP-dependent helicase/nuclease subunit B
MRDPYAIYARYVLDLEPLEPIDADPGAAERGTAVHRALDRFIRDYPDRLPGNALDELLRLGREAFAAMLTRPGIAAFWWPRFERVAGWFLAEEARRRSYARPLKSEVRGELTLPGPAGPFVLTAHADRIDRLADGRLAIVDYKTGAPPSEAEVKRGYAPQLPLEAAIARAGGFEGIPAAPVGELAHWRLGGGRQPGEARAFKADPGELADEALARLRAMIEAFDDPATPYLARPLPALAPRFADYEHLARIKEWATAEGEA